MSRRHRVGNSHVVAKPITARRQMSSLDERLCHDFFYHASTILTRYGLSDGYFIVKRHEDQIANVKFFAVCRRYGIEREVKLLPAMKEALHERFERLTCGTAIRFGRIIIEIRAGHIHQAEFINSVRPVEASAPSILARYGIGTEMSISGRRFRSRSVIDH